MLSARVSTKTKERLDRFCDGEIDGMKYIQESVVELAINRYIDKLDHKK